MDALRSWIINICTTVFFITAVEMLLPNNNLKKYSKFVLGLILMTVIINPLVKFLNKGTEVTTFINKTTSTVEQFNKTDDAKLKEKNISDTLNVFKTNLEKLCDNKLKEKYPKFTCRTEADVSFNADTQEFTIKNIKIGMNDGAVDKVGKIDVRTSNDFQKNNVDDSKNGREVKNYLSGVLDLPENKITVYKLAR